MIKVSSKLRVGIASLAMMSLGVACGGGGGDDKAEDKDTPTDGQDPNDPNNTGAGTIALSLTADGMGSIVESAALRLAVEDEEYGYPGIGMNFGESIVEGFKIKLLSISMYQVNEDGMQGAGAKLVDWGEEGKELQIAEGFNGKIEVTDDVTILPGSYKQVGIQTESAFELKAYAYLDSDNDGAIDTTIYTTADGIVKEASKLDPGSMPDYDYYRYPWLVATTAKSLTDNSDSPSMTTTMLPEPIVIDEDGVVSKDEDGNESKAAELSINVLVDTFRLIKVWDGRFPSGGPWVKGDGDPVNIPAPVFPFPQGLNDSRTLSEGLKTYDFYPEGEPAFALGNYPSIYAMVNSTGLKAQNYLISKTEEITPYNTQLMTLILDAEGTPLFAKMGLGESNETLHIGPMARKFEKQDDGSYTFGTAYGMKDENDKFDGGLYYSDDLTKAGHLFSDFRKLQAGQRAEMLMENGPRCSEEYDYCVDDAGVTAYYQRVQ